MKQKCTPEEMQTIQKAFDSLFVDQDEIRAEMEKIRIYSNQQTEEINAIVRELILFKQHLHSALQIISADDPELVRRTRESVEIFMRRMDAEIEKENTK